MAGGSVTVPSAPFNGSIVGGIVGQSLDSSVMQAVLAEDASVIGGRYSDTGGIVGYSGISTAGASAEISEAVSLGYIETGYLGYAGGVAGRNSRGMVTNCYAAGNVVANESSGDNTVLGGVVGQNERNDQNGGEAPVQYVHYAGTIMDKQGGQGFLGAVIGWNNGGSLDSAHYDSDLAGVSEFIGWGDQNETSSTALTSVQMTQQGNFPNFNFAQIWSMGAAYPVLTFQQTGDSVNYLVVLQPGEHGSINEANSEDDFVDIYFEGADFPSVNVSSDMGYDFVGFDPPLPDIVSGNFEATAQYEATPQYTVTFDAGAGGSITAGDAVQTVYEGEDAAEPTIEANEGWEFAGWDTDFTNVQSDLTVTAQYELTYTVNFLSGANGTITSGDTEQTVADGGSATAPTVEANTGWEFTGWDTDFTNVQSDLTVTAQYEATRQYTVTFDAGAGGSITSGEAVQTVYEGGDAEAPEITPNAPYIFAGWDKEFTNVQSEITVTAQYDTKTFTVTFNAGQYGIISEGQSQQTIEYGSSAASPSVEADQGWEFAGWDTPFDNVTSDLAITAEYSFAMAGSGTPEDPYQIKTAQDLGMADYALSARYVLINDIDLSEENFYSIGDSEEPFAGSFDGNDNKIQHLNKPIFYSIGEAGKAINLGIEEVDISMSSTNSFSIGSIAKKCRGTIENCYVSGNVEGGDDTGGLVGHLYYEGSLINCSSTAMVHGDNRVGGLVGRSNGGTIENCYAAGAESENGYLQSIDGTEDVGGICGLNFGTIESCCSEISVFGSRSVGGLCGKNSGHIKNSYSTEWVSCLGDNEEDDTVCGFCGKNSGTIKHCYSTSWVGGDDNPQGGFCGEKSYSTELECFWDIETSTVDIGYGKINGLDGDDEIYS
ncbi:GLUG domain protein [Sedimentisphaera cyanobacteriorum]|uniref:GLUG domain protein n=2 Tax=Sedimentisphaera cyanobacteriorum TaxID=1940790 RepID=A0A1Q2HQN0_9BACT|nr:GLUG domain protein [Sedimentisphaera cyanobacteriorum]